MLYADWDSEIEEYVAHWEDLPQLGEFFGSTMEAAKDRAFDALHLHYKHIRIQNQLEQPIAIELPVLAKAVA